MRDGAPRAGEQIIDDLAPGERAERGGAHEALGCARHGDADLAASLLEPTQHLAGLVRGYAAAHIQRDATGTRCVLHVYSSPSSDTIRILLQYGQVVMAGPRLMSLNELGCSATRQAEGLFPESVSTATPA